MQPHHQMPLNSSHCSFNILHLLHLVRDTKCSHLSLQCDPQRCVGLEMGAVTGDLCPSRHAAADVSAGTGLQIPQELQRDLVTIITAGIL